MRQTYPTPHSILITIEDDRFEDVPRHQARIYALNEDHLRLMQENIGHATSVEAAANALLFIQRVREEFPYATIRTSLFLRKLFLVPEEL